VSNSKISALTSATTPLAGTEVLPIVQSSATVKVATNDLTVRNVRANATTGILQVTGPTAGTTWVATVPDANWTAARTDAAQSFTGDQTLSTGNVVIGTSGKGIDFSATPNTGTSELLADYEEGSWTPVVAGGTTAGTYTYSAVQAGQYTKVGRIVTATCSLYNIGVTSAGTGGLTITGLPYTASSNSANNRGLVGVTWLRNFSTAHNNIITITSGTVIYFLYDNNGTGGGTDYPVTEIVNGSSQIGCTVVYYV
jgi:hypothetical protein